MPPSQGGKAWGGVRNASAPMSCSRKCCSRPLKAPRPAICSIPNTTPPSIATGGVNCPSLAQSLLLRELIQTVVAACDQHSAWLGSSKLKGKLSESLELSERLRQNLSSHPSSDRSSLCPQVLRLSSNDHAKQPGVPQLLLQADVIPCPRTGSRERKESHAHRS
jgi:hypothetical protein